MVAGGRPGRHGALTLLLVEDEPAHAELMVRSLENYDGLKEIHHVSDGEAALDYLCRRDVYRDPVTSPRPHVIFLDVRLPKIDGLEVLRQIRASTALQKIPVVVITTSDAERDVARAQALQADSYVVKPIDLSTFTQVMRELGY